MIQRRRAPTLRMRRLALELRQLRERSGLSREQIAEATEINRATLYRIETAQAKPQVRTLRALLDAYRVPEEYQSELVSLLKSAGEERWLRAASDVPAQYATYIACEQEARGVLNYESLFIPGLFQTEAYARTVIPGGAPELPSNEVEGRVAARMARQAPRDPALIIKVIIDEAALHRRVGSASIMREQLRRLLNDSEQPHITIQVIPYDVGAHPGMHGSFVILCQDFNDLVYIEARTTDLFLEGEQDVKRYHLMFEQLGNIAATPKGSRDLIARVLSNVD